MKSLEELEALFGQVAYPRKEVDIGDYLEIFYLLMLYKQTAEDAEKERMQASLERYRLQDKVVALEKKLDEERGKTNDE